MQTRPLFRPEPTEHVPYYAQYIQLVPENDVIAALTAQIPVVRDFFAKIPAARAGYRYAEGKWSIREVLGHLTDSERIMSYRALRFARNDATPLPGFEEDDYVRNAAFDGYDLPDLVSEWEHVRRASISLFSHLAPAAWARRGSANGSPITVRALAFILVGHPRHHLEVVRTRYLG